MNLKTVRAIDRYIGIPLVYIVSIIKKIFLKITCKGKQSAPPSISKILLVKFWGIGNIIMLLPVAKALKEKYPSAKIDILTLASNKNVPGDTDIFSSICTIDTHRASSFISTSLKAFGSLWKRDYDLVIDFEQFARFSALFCALISRKKAIGFDTRGQYRRPVYTDTIPYNNDIHMVRSFLSLISAEDIDYKKYLESISTVYGESNRARVLEILRKNGISEKDTTVIFHIGTSENFSLRRWPPEKFSELANRLLSDYEIKIVFTGMAQEDYLVKEAMSGIDKQDSIIDTCGVFSFEDFLSLVKLSDLIISADTSPVHIASCLSVPVVGLYGPNTPILYGPWSENSISFYKNISCSPCITNYNAKMSKCAHPEGLGACMEKIGADEVFSGIKNNYFNPDAPFRIKELGKDEKVFKPI